MLISKQKHKVGHPASPCTTSTSRRSSPSGCSMNCPCNTLTSTSWKPPYSHQIHVILAGVRDHTDSFFETLLSKPSASSRQLVEHAVVVNGVSYASSQANMPRVVRVHLQTHSSDYMYACCKTAPPHSHENTYPLRSPKSCHIKCPFTFCFA